MDVVKYIRLEMRNGWTMEFKPTDLRGMKILGANKENIVRVNREFIKLNTADEIGITIACERNYDEYFDMGSMKLFERLKHKDIRKISVIYDNGKEDVFDLFFSKIEVFEYSDSHDLRILCYIPEDTFETLRD